MCTSNLFAGGLGNAEVLDLSFLLELLQLFPGLFNRDGPVNAMLVI